jgi:hypothetical protein
METKRNRYDPGFASMADLVRERNQRERRLDEFNRFVDEVIERGDSGKATIVTVKDTSDKVVRAIWERLRQNKAYFLLNNRNRDWLLFFRRPTYVRKAA